MKPAHRNAIARTKTFPRFTVGSEQPQLTVEQRLLKSSEYIIGGGVFLYLLGFVIENIYLGSFGAAIFDILKARYILIGCLFAIFVFSVWVPLANLARYCWKDTKKNLLTLFFRTLVNGVITLLVLFFATPILSILSGSGGTQPLSLNPLNPPAPLNDWFSIAFPAIFPPSLKQTIYFFSFIIALLLVISVSLFVHDTIKRRSDSSHESQLKLYWKSLAAKGTRLVDLVITTLLIFLYYPVLISFYNFLSTNEAITCSFGCLSLQSLGFGRFSVAVVACYLMLSLPFITVIQRGKGSLVDPDLIQKIFGKVISYIVIAAVFVVFLIPIYSYGVYPLIPQQIGGGAAIHIELTAKDPNSQARLELPKCNPYLIDRTSVSILILCVGSKPNEYQAIEVQLDQIESLAFIRNPLP